MGEAGEHRAPNTGGYGNIEAIEMTAAGSAKELCSPCNYECPAG